MSYCLLDLSQKNKWNDLLKSLPPDKQDVYFTPEYYSLYENLGFGEAKCFVFQKENDFAIYPFLINSVNNLGYSLDNQYFDIQGAYGYNGVVSSTDDKNFVEVFYNVFQDFIIDSNIIAEFTRFNPILRNQVFSKYHEIINDQPNVFVNLKINDFEKESYEYSTVKNIKKAKRNLLSCEVHRGSSITINHLKIFLDIYTNTMNRNKAERFYYFPLSYFESLITNLNNNCVLYFTTFCGEYISTELVLYGNTIAYSFLGGTLSEFFKYRPNDFLKDYVIKDLKAHGLEIFCLGGGSNGVFRYKKSFSKNGVIPFFIGKKIHNNKIYNEVIEQWSSKSLEKINHYNNFLLKYRY